MIKIYSIDKEVFNGMKAASKIAAEGLNYIENYIKPGISTLELDNLMEKFIINNGAYPAPREKGFPGACCISLNHVVCHGIPSAECIIHENDILNIDISLNYKGYYGDTSRMFHGGKPSKIAQRLMKTTKMALDNAIKVCIPGMTLGCIGNAIVNTVEPVGFSIVRDFTGHGIGKELHMEPTILHYGIKGQGQEIKEGMYFTIEPMINAGKHEVKVLNDKWTVVTKDLSLSAQYEHVVYVDSDGPIVLSDI